MCLSVFCFSHVSFQKDEDVRRADWPSPPKVPRMCSGAHGEQFSLFSPAQDRTGACPGRLRIMKESGEPATPPLHWAGLSFSFNKFSALLYVYMDHQGLKAGDLKSAFFRGAQEFPHQTTWGTGANEDPCALDLCICAKSLWSCPTLCDPMDSSLPGSSVHGILQARILKWLPGPPPGCPGPTQWTGWSGSKETAYLTSFQVIQLK